ncbi:MAG: hypothetical protein KDA42_08230 [Planctomycetales bacterium]|nr:hypothetical protein [Planctomycetales bacterium]
MTISLKCSCGNSLQVDDNLAGSQATCPNCNATISVPADDLSLDSLDLDDLSLDDLDNLGGDSLSAGSLDDLDDMELDVAAPPAKQSPALQPQTVAPSLDDDDDYELELEAPEVDEPLDMGLEALTGLEDDLGGSLDSPASATDSAPLAAPAASDKCPGCGAECAPGAAICVACGLDLRTGEKHSGLPGGAAGAAAASTKGEGGGFFQQYKIAILASAGGLVVVLAVVAALMFSGGDEPATSVASNSTSGTTSDDASDYSSDEPAQPPTIDDSVSKPSEDEGSLDGEDSAPSNAGDSPAAGEDPSAAELVASLEGHTAEVIHVAFSDDAARAVSIDSRGTAIVWSLADAAELQKLTIGPRGKAAFLPGGEKLLVHEGRNQLKVIDLATGQPEQTIEGAVGGELAMAVDSDGKKALLSGARDALVSVDLASGRASVAAVEFPRETKFVRFSPDGRTAVVADGTPTPAVWDVPLQQQLRVLDGHVTELRALVISPDSKQALSAAGGHEMTGDPRAPKVANDKITDLAVRLWDLASGDELRRFRIDSPTPARAVAFVGGEYGVWLGEELYVFDLQSGRVLCSIAVGAGSEPVPAAGGRPLARPGVEPKVAISASADGKRLLFAAGNAVQVWRLPDLAAIRRDLPTLPTRAPLPQLASATTDTGSETLAMDANTKVVWRVVAKHHGALKELWQHLNARPRTPDNLMKIAQWCVKERLYLEGEECLRAVLAVAPETPKAAAAYEKLASFSNLPPRAVAPADPIARLPEGKLTDDIQEVVPPEGKSLVVIPLDFDAQDDAVRIDDKSLLANTAEGPAQFLGILREPSAEVKGLARNEPQPAKKTQLWEMAIVNTRGDEVTMRLQNRERPVRESKQRGRPPNNSDPIAMRTDRSYFEEPYAGPYEAVFAVPAGAALTGLKYGEEPVIGLLAAEPESISAALANSSLPPERLATLLQVAASNPGPSTSQQLDTIIASGADSVFFAARSAQRKVRRQRNLLAPVFHPEPLAGQSYLESLVIDAEPAAADPRRPVAPPTGPRPTRIAATWNLPQAGRYLARVFAFGVAAKYELKATVFVDFESKEPGLFYWSHVVPGDAAAPNRVVELWQNGLLLERSLIALDEAAAAEIAGRVPLLKPEVPAASAPVRQPPIRRPPPPRRPPGTASEEEPEVDVAELIAEQPVVPVPAVALMSATERDLPLVYRVARYYFQAEVDAAESERQKRALAEVGRLEAANPAARAKAATELSALLGDWTAGLFVRLLSDGPDSVRRGAIEGLTQLAPHSTEACRALLAQREVDTAPVIEKLVADGILETRNGDWLLNGEVIHTDPASQEPADDAAGEDSTNAANGDDEAPAAP